MIARVKLFAVAAQLAGADEIEVALSAEPTIASLRTALSDQYPALRQIMPHLMFAVNSQYANDQTPIETGTEIACIPPVSGG